VGRRVYLATEPDLVPDRHGPAQAHRRDGDRGHRPRRRSQKKAIERAYAVAEAAGIQVWTQDEAGPYQAIPQPGPSWQPEGEPVRLPHEYVRGGTAKLLTLFRPATGEVRADAVRHATNAVLHPWLKDELTAVLAACPPAPPAGTPGYGWADWDWHPDAHLLDRHLPPVRVVVIWDNLKGHHSAAIVRWCAARGILPLYTPIGGSWLNMAESLQRILVRRALGGQHPQSAQEVIDWLEATVRGWNAAPTAFAWGGKRAARRARARARRHALGGSGAYTRRPIRRLRPAA
jgi:hypothetical protein